jgi:hypothetical protein
MRTLAASLVLVWTGCAETTPCCVTSPALLQVAPAPPPPPPQPPPPAECCADEASAMALVEPQVLILQTSHLDRLSEVVGVVDVHERMGHHDAALADMRQQAAALGADAVVGVEFHHGHGEDEPTHLSGLAVRFIRLH